MGGFKILSSQKPLLCVYTEEDEEGSPFCVGAEVPSTAASAYARTLLCYEGGGASLYIHQLLIKFIFIKVCTA